MHTALYLLSVTFYLPTSPCTIGFPHQEHALIVSYVGKSTESFKGLHSSAFIGLCMKLSLNNDVVSAAQ